MQIKYLIIGIGLLCGAVVGGGTYAFVFLPSHQRIEQRQGATQALASVCAGLKQQGVQSGLCP